MFHGGDYLHTWICKFQPSPVTKGGRSCYCNTNLYWHSELGSTRSKVKAKPIDIVRGFAGGAMFVLFACCVLISAKPHYFRNVDGTDPNPVAPHIINLPINDLITS